MVRSEGTAPQCLLVRSKTFPDRWIFPKGHIKKGEATTDAAMREVREEAGVETRMIELAGSIRFREGWRIRRTDYYLLEFVREVGSAEMRESLWCSFEEALKHLFLPDADELLRNADAILQRRRSS